MGVNIHLGSSEIYNLIFDCLPIPIENLYVLGIPKEMQAMAQPDTQTEWQILRIALWLNQLNKIILLKMVSDFDFTKGCNYD